MPRPRLPVESESGIREMVHDALCIRSPCPLRLEHAPRQTLGCGSAKNFAWVAGRGAQTRRPSQGYFVKDLISPPQTTLAGFDFPIGASRQA